MATLDVTVRGAGVFGLTAAFACLERGARVRVVDPRGPGGGASGGIVGALAPHMPNSWNEKKAFQFACLEDAEARWRRVEAVSGIPVGYGRTGRLQPLADDRAVALVRSRMDDAERNWGTEFLWRIVDADTLDGWTPASRTGLFLFDTLSARLHPRQACESLGAAILALGGTIADEAADEGHVIHAEGWEGLVVLSEALEAGLGGGVKGQAALLRHAAPAGAPQVFVDGLHIVPHADGTVAIGSTSEREFDDPTATDDALDALVDRAMEAMPILHGAAMIERWAGVRPRARSRAPLVGPWPGRAGHVIANGGFKIGFGIAWGVADLVADLVLKGRDRVPRSFRTDASL